MQISLFLGLCIFSIVISVLLHNFLDWLLMNLPRKFYFLKSFNQIISWILIFLSLIPAYKYFGIFINAIYPVSKEVNALILPILFSSIALILQKYIKKYFTIFKISTGLLSGVYLWTTLGISSIHIPFLNISLQLGILIIPLISLLNILIGRGLASIKKIESLNTGSIFVIILGFWALTLYTLDTISSTFLAIWIAILFSQLIFDIKNKNEPNTIDTFWIYSLELVTISFISGKTVATLLMSIMLIWAGITNPIAKFQKHGWEDSKIMFRGWLACIVSVIFGLWLGTF